MTDESIPKTPLKMEGTQRVACPSHRRKAKTVIDGLAPTSNDRDDQIMNTNNSSIVSKRSVEKSYYSGEEYFRPFVRKYQRRAPLINRGYWLRMKGIDHTVHQFLLEPGHKQKLVVNLGCGYDPLPFQYLGRFKDLCRKCTFVDVDYPALLQRKVKTIHESAILRSLLPDLEIKTGDAVELARATGYRAVGCDLRQLDLLEATLRQAFQADERDLAVLFVAEVSVAYMDKAPANALIKWAARFVPDTRFCLLEQHLPDGRDHPFAQTMLRHFHKLRAPLSAIGTTSEMRERFVDAGWASDHVDIKTLWEVWGDCEIVPPSLKQELDRIEPFDEWEEFALFGAHYFLLVARSSQSVAPPPRPDLLTATNQSAQSLSYERVLIGDKSYGRRFGAAFNLQTDSEADSHTIVHCGGHGVRERLANCDIYTTRDTVDANGCTSIPAALVCHTTTSFGAPEQPRYLLCGGRTSPGKPSAACWLYENQRWTKQADMPRPRYRHCAVACTIQASNGESPTQGVLVFGGRSDKGEALGDFLWWAPGHGWQMVQVETGNRPTPRFSAAMSNVGPESNSGCLAGGMDLAGEVFDDLWDWQLVAENGNMQLKITCRAGLRGRFGAVMAQHGTQTLLIGGIAAGKLLTHEEEITDVNTGLPILVPRERRQLLVGFSAVSVPAPTSGCHELLILGGGATCFSFGTFLNQSYVLRQSGDGWAWQTRDGDKASSSTASLVLPGSMMPESTRPSAVRVERIKIDTATSFEEAIKRRQPVVVEQANIGSCVQMWNSEYLVSKVGADRQVTIHECQTPHMNFSDRNFKYAKMSFAEFMAKADQGQHVYLRALSAAKPADQPADLADDYPEIASDFQLPPIFEHARRNQHSSPLRISGAVSMWLHYDVMANILCQVRGTKRLVLFPPSDVTRLDFAPGASSSALNPFTTRGQDHAGLAGARAHDVELRPGDVLFLPPMWLHAAQPTAGLSVAVNVFFRDEEMVAGYAAGRDVYGNRDLAAYERGRRDAQRIVTAFDGVPGDVRRFYLERIAGELLGGVERGS